MGSRGLGCGIYGFRVMGSGFRGLWGSGLAVWVQDSGQVSDLQGVWGSLDSRHTCPVSGFPKLRTLRLGI